MSKRVEQLTGLATGLEDDLKQLVNKHDGLALALLDLDNFMEINTTYGHETGDQVLKVLSDLLREAFPDGAYRTGGDEFGVVMPGVALEQAFLRMEALRAKVQAAADRFALPDGRAVTMTAGVAHFSRDAKDAASLQRMAYAALIAAKEGGRNQVALPPNEDMVMKSCYYAASSVRRLKTLAEQVGRKESALLREALDDLLRKYDPA